MKALLSEAPGGPQTLVLRELPDPEPGPGQLLVRVRAAAINYPDVLIIEDKYQFKPERPFAPGGEVSGVVKSVGEGVTHVKPGEILHLQLVVAADGDYSLYVAMPDSRHTQQGFARRGIHINREKLRMPLRPGSLRIFT